MCHLSALTSSSSSSFLNATRFAKPATQLVVWDRSSHSTSRPAWTRQSPTSSAANVNNDSTFRHSAVDRVKNSPPMPPSTADAQPIRLFNRIFYISGRAMLIATPFIWGGYTVSIKLLYLLPWSLNAAVFNALRLAMASLLVLPGLVRYLRNRRGPSGQKSSAIGAGVEIGFWTFVVNTLQIFGLRYTTASRGAFLNQLSTVIVPFAAALCGMESSISFPILMASFLSVAGVAFLSLDDVKTPFTLLGDGVLLASAFAGAIFVLRCKRHADHPDGDAVVAMKIVSQFFFSLIYILPMIARSLFSASAGKTILAAFQGATPMLIFANLALMVYNGVIVSWLSTVLQLRGQKLVSASEAVIIFTSTPLWSAALAIPLGERFGLNGIIGAVLLIFGALIASGKRRQRAPKKLES